MSDKITFRCPSCEKKISVRKDYAGKKARCPGCDVPIQIPVPEPVADDAADGSGLFELADTVEEPNTTPAAEASERACPACGASVSAAAAICVQCGHNFATGQTMATQQLSKRDEQRIAAAQAEADEEHGSNIWVILFGCVVMIVFGGWLFTAPDLSEQDDMPKWILGIYGLLGPYVIGGACILGGVLGLYLFGKDLVQIMKRR